VKLEKRASLTLRWPRRNKAFVYRFEKYHWFGLSWVFQHLTQPSAGFRLPQNPFFWIPLKISEQGLIYHSWTASEGLPRKTFFCRWCRQTTVARASVEMIGACRTIASPRSFNRKQVEMVWRIDGSFETGSTVPFWFWSPPHHFK
jgi:hypothetical protein